MSDDIYSYQHPLETLASSWSGTSAGDMSTSVYRSAHPIREMGDVARQYNNVQASNKASGDAAAIESKRCDGAIGCFTDCLGGSAKTIGGVITNPATLLCAAAVAGTVASAGTLVAVAAGVCLGAAYANLGKQGADYANDLGKHNWNPADTAADGWAPYQNAIDTGRYDQLGQMTTGTALTWGGDALLIYGGIKGLQGASGGGATQNPAVNRVYLRSSTRQSIQDGAPKTAGGDFIDPNTGQIIPKGGPFDYGHRPGFEWWRTQQLAGERGWTRQQVIEWENDPSHYQIENPSSNRSHLYEMP